MTKAIKITIDNKMVTEKRDMNVYHHDSQRAHMISHNSSVTIPLKTTAEGDYMYISIVSGPGNLECNSIIDLPAWVNFRLRSGGNLDVIHQDDRTVLKIPAGLPEWKLKLSRPTTVEPLSKDRVLISEDHTGDDWE